MPRIWVWTMRIAGAIVSFILLFQSMRIAEADALADSPRPGDLAHAIALEPQSERYVMRKVSADLYNDAVSPVSTEKLLMEILQKNPRNAEASMDLGILAELRGDNSTAERYFKRAVDCDLTFKPSWTLINFYFRTNQLEKMWPEIRKALDVTTKTDMLYFDVQPIYNLCWQTGADPKLILGLIPNRPAALMSYFVHLVGNKHTQAAVEVYPRVFPLAEPSSKFQASVFAEYSNLLFQENRIGEAVEVWNRLVKYGFLASTELHSERAESIANPLFQFPFEHAPFGWKTNGDVVMTYIPRSVLFDFDGREPAVSLLLRKDMPLLSDVNYFMTWVADASRIARPTDPKEIGLSVGLYDGDRPVPAKCSAFFAPEKERGCSFHVPPGVQTLNIRVISQRLPGSMKIRGTLQLNGFQLKFLDRSNS